MRPSAVWSDILVRKDMSWMGSLRDIVYRVDCGLMTPQFVDLFPAVIQEGLQTAQLMEVNLFILRYYTMSAVLGLS